MARVIRAPVLGQTPRLLYVDAGAPLAVPDDVEPDVAPSVSPDVEHRVADELRLQVATLELELAELRLRLDNWRQEEAARTDMVRREARELGFAEGQERGLAEGREALRERCERARDLIEALGKQVTDRATDCEDSLVSIAFAAVCKVLGEKGCEVEGIRALVRQACAELGAQEALRVRLHPDDVALIDTRGGDGCSGAVLVPDAAVSMGGCYVESASGTLDARLETQLAELAALLSATRAARRLAESVEL